MLTPGDVVELNLGASIGSEAGLRRPAVVVTAGRIIRGDPDVVQVVPETRTLRQGSTEVIINPDEGNGLAAPCWAKSEKCRDFSWTYDATHSSAALRQCHWVSRAAASW